MSDERDDGGYQVGYRKPPKHSQFKKGQCGNVEGRPRKSRWRKSSDTMRLEFIDAMEQQVVVKANGSERRKPAIRALYDMLLAKALQGDFRVGKLLFESYCKFLTDDEDARLRLTELLYEVDEARSSRTEEEWRNQHRPPRR